MRNITEGIMNKDRKLAFLKEKYGDNYPYRSTILKVMEKCEDFYGKDICELTENQLYPFLNNIGKNYNTIITYISVLNSYIKYCYDKKFPGALNTKISYKKDSLKYNMKSSMVASPSDLQRVLDKLFPSVTAGEYANILRCCCWLLYAGLELDEAADIKIDDIRLNEQLISYNGNFYPIYPESLEVIRFCIDSDNIVVQGGKLLYSKKRLNNHLLLRSFNEINASKLRDGITKRANAATKNGKCDVAVTCRSIFRSGLFYRAYMRNDDSLKIDVKPFENNVKAPKKSDHALYEKNRGFKNDYIEWKKCFYTK